MDKDEALKLALEALKDYVEEHGPHEKDSGAAYVIAVIKEALAQTMDDMEVMIAYLMLKVKEKDWHGVADAANDIRVMEARKKNDE
jgi:20S proteasome alpha/beta subunit